LKKGPIWRLLFLALTVLLIFGISAAQEKPKAKEVSVNPIVSLTKAMTDRLANNLNVEKAVGKPIKVGKVTIVPIVMIDVGFGGGGGGPQMVAQGFGMGGEAKPLGFVVITKAGTKFIPVGKVPRK
jgi:uncharacterized spore protein YtfJ